MKIRSVAVRMACWSAFCGLALLSYCADAAEPNTPEPNAPEQSTVEPSTADDEFIGVLRFAVNENGANLLGLKPTTRQALAKLVSQRIADGKQQLDISDLPPAERQLRLDRWVQESERLGQQLLTIAQREKLMQLLLSREGMVTLAREDVSKFLNLSEPQKEEVAELVKARQMATATFPPLQKQIAVGRYERRLQSLLTAAQLAKWEQLAGLAILETVAKQPPPNEAQSDTPKVATPELNDVKLQFTFERAPWREVVDWLAKEAKLSLYVGSMPTGSFTYTDQQEYTPDQAIARINRFLLSLGYTLVRSGKMLSVIGLEDSRRDELLDSLAEFASQSELDDRDDNEVVKCVFTIANADAKAALEEIRPLVKLSTPLLMPKSRQLVIIETAARLRMVRDTLKALENPDAEDSPVRPFELEHIRAEKVLVTVRPLVGIAGETSNVGENINLTSSADGKLLLATGSEEKLAIVANIVKMLDKEPSETSGSNALVLRPHPVEGKNLQAVDDVLQTLLEGENVRLAQEPKTSRLIVLATEEIHKRVEETIEQLQAESAVFEVIQLKRVETFVAMSLLREMLDIPYYSDEEDETKDYPRLDWDSPSRRIFVRGTRRQVDEVIQILDRLEQPREAKKNSTLRLLPIQGARAEKLLETGKRFWTGDDDVMIFPPSSEPSGDVIEREINGEEKPAGPAAPTDDRSPAPRNRDATTTFPTSVESQDADPPPPKPETVGNRAIKAQVTPRGILLQSKDVELLNRFEDHLRMIAGPDAFSDTRMAIFYLKHVGAEEAKSLLSDIRRGESSYGGESSMDDEESDGADGPRRRSYYSYSAPSVIADARLNRLIVQGTMVEILQIEKNLKIIDRDKSIADVQVRGKSHVLQLVHIRAHEAASIVRDAFAHELIGSAPAQPTAQQQKQQQQQLQQLQLQVQQQQQQQPTARQPKRPGAATPVPAGAAKKPDSKAEEKSAPAQPSSGTSSDEQRTRTQAPKMTLAVNETSNSLIIRAPEPLFEEVSELIQLIDKNATQTTQVISLRGMNPDQLRRVLQDTLGGSGSSRSSQNGNPTPKQNNEPAAVQTIIRPSQR